MVVERHLKMSSNKAKKKKSTTKATKDMTDRLFLGATPRSSRSKGSKDEDDYVVECIPLTPTTPNPYPKGSRMMKRKRAMKNKGGNKNKRKRTRPGGNMGKTKKKASAKTVFRRRDLAKNDKTRTKKTTKDLFVVSAKSVKASASNSSKGGKGSTPVPVRLDQRFWKFDVICFGKTRSHGFVRK